MEPMSFAQRVEARRAEAATGPFHYKAVDISDAEVNSKRGIVTAYAARFGVPDLGHLDPSQRVSDIIQEGAFDRTLAKKWIPGDHRRSQLAVLLGHDPGRVVGHPVRVEPDQKGLVTETQYNLNTFYGNEAFHLVDAGDITQYSIGWLPERQVKAMSYRDGKRLLHAIDLFEYGPLPLGMNPGAVVIGVKGLNHDVAFTQLVDQAANGVMDLMISLETLVERRQEKSLAGTRYGQTLSTDIMEAVQGFANDAEVAIASLRSMAVAQDPEGSEAPPAAEATDGPSDEETAEAPPVPETKSLEVAQSLKLSLELARARARHIGLEVS